MWKGGNCFAKEDLPGYFSKRDLEVHEFAICESCYEKMIDQFVIPVKKTEKIEVLHEDLI